MVRSGTQKIEIYSHADSQILSICVCVCLYVSLCVCVCVSVCLCLSLIDYFRAIDLLSVDYRLTVNFLSVCLPLCLSVVHNVIEWPPLCCQELQLQKQHPTGLLTKTDFVEFFSRLVPDSRCLKY